jgi:hypothetical protein
MIGVAPDARPEVAGSGDVGKSGQLEPGRGVMVNDRLLPFDTPPCTSLVRRTKLLRVYAEGTKEASRAGARGHYRHLIRHPEPGAPHAATTPQAVSSRDRPTDPCVRRRAATQRARGPQPETGDPCRLLDLASALARAPQPCRACGPRSLPGEHSHVAPSFRRADMSSSCGSVLMCERLLRQSLKRLVGHSRFTRRARDKS